ncbi:hypothetical protein C6990_03345 [Nitrosopumilus sp. b3]|uniref:hypothetical protein n=1 Tax=Nitrosopumilus sp. b3 TaxID=2109909 RepID=UPI0015F543F5|nr:hypothetical protein [Nitrosopumilus sp. b3]KAF6247503.1 hypothetical protein C6990_03345 [Nitrosopumilus sp. b3]
MRKRGFIGIVHKGSKSNARCDRCDIPLTHSKWNGVSVCYSVSKSSLDGFICIQCALGYRKTTKPKTTSQEVDAFTKHLKKEPVLLA